MERNRLNIIPTEWREGLCDLVDRCEGAKNPNTFGNFCSNGMNAYCGIKNSSSPEEYASGVIVR